MGVRIRDFGEVQPQCSSCGVGLCWSIGIDEYNLHKGFWDDWCCRDCNPNYLGAYERYKQMTTKTVAFTGHRPEKLNGYDPKDNKNLLWELHSRIVDHIENKNVSIFITGMALGIDMWAARIVLKLRDTLYPHLHLVAAIPCANQESRWRQESKDEYNEILDRCNDVYYVSNEPYTAWCMHKRDEWMVDNADMLIAVWDGTPGGTAHTHNYAVKVGKPIDRINPIAYK